MDYLYLLVSLLPLVLYVLFSIKKDQMFGVIGGMVGFVILLVYVIFKHGVVDEFIWLEGILLIGLGSLSLFFNNSCYFKFQPCVVGIILGILFLYHQFFDTPIFVKMTPKIKELVPQFAEFADDPVVQEAFTKTSLYMALVFLIHGVMMGYAALKLSDISWFNVRILVYPMMIVAVALGYF